jgi:hypothetical protein
LQIQNVLIVLSTLSNDDDFDDVSLNSQFLQQLHSEQFSYENLFTTSTDNYKRQIVIKYICVVGQNIDNITYSINFLFENIISQVLINTILSNGINIDESEKDCQ